MATLGIKDKDYRPNQYINPMLISQKKEPAMGYGPYKIFDKNNPEHPDYKEDDDDEDMQLSLPLDYVKNKRNQNMTIANQSLTPKDFGPIKLYGVPHIRTPYIKEFEMDNFRRFIKSTTGEDFPTAQNKNNLLIAGGTGQTSMMNYVTETGCFLDGRGKAYMQTEGEFYDAGEYDVDVHGLPVPLAKKQKRRSELQIA